MATKQEIEIYKKVQNERWRAIEDRDEGVWEFHGGKKDVTGLNCSEGVVLSMFTEEDGLPDEEYDAIPEEQRCFSMSMGRWRHTINLHSGEVGDGKLHMDGKSCQLGNAKSLKDAEAFREGLRDLIEKHTLTTVWWPDCGLEIVEEMGEADITKTILAYEDE